MIDFLLYRLPYFAIAGLLCWLTYLMYKKSWQKQFTVTLLLAFVAFFCAFGWFQGFFKSGVVSLLIQGIENLGHTLDNYNKSTETVRQDLIQVANSIKMQQTTLQVTQSEINKVLQDAAVKQTGMATAQERLNTLAEELQEGQTAVKTAQGQMEAHQKQIQDLRGLTKVLYEQRTVETFDNTPARKVWIGKKADGSFGIFLALSRIPIPQTVDIQTEEFNVIPTAVYPHKNVLLYKVTGTSDYLRKQRWFISYVPDPTRQTEEMETIKIDSNTNFVAGGIVFREYFAVGAD